MSTSNSTKKKYFFDKNAEMAFRENSRIIVQNDWPSVLRTHGNTVWVTFKEPGRPGVHGELRSYSEQAAQSFHIDGDDNFQVQDFTKKTLTVKYIGNENNHAQQFLAPSQIYSTIHSPKSSVDCIDVTPGGLGVSFQSNDDLKLWTTNNGEVRRTFKGHVGDVYSCRFFPSGVVVLSSGADSRLKIWSAETGKCAATITGHTSGVLSTAIIERGRNILSASRDGSAKLWDVSHQECITTFLPEHGVVNDLCLHTPPQEFDLGNPAHPPGTDEIGTDGKLLLLGCENGHTTAYGLNTRQKVFDIPGSDAVNCVAFLNETMFVLGTQNGFLHVYDIRSTDAAISEIKESRSAILSLLPYSNGYITSTADGSCYHSRMNHVCHVDLTGPDCDPVYKVVTDNKHIYTCCRDGLIRRYSYG